MVELRKTHNKKTTRKLMKDTPSDGWISEHFRLLVEGVKDYAIFMLDKTGHIISWNIGAERLKGYRENEIVGKHFSIFYTPEAIQKGIPDNLLHKAITEGQIRDEGWRVRKNGTKFWADVLITPMCDSRGQFIGFSKVTRNLTERKLLEEGLQKEKNQIQDIIDSSPSVIFQKDIHGRYVRVNTQFKKLFGLPADQVIGKTDLELFSPKQAAQFMSNDQQVLSAGIPLMFEELAQYQDGVHTNIVHKYPLKNPDGTIYAISGIVTDITIQKNIEEELRNTTEKLQAILRASPPAILTIDASGCILSWSKGAETLFGWTEEETLGRFNPTVPESAVTDFYSLISRGISGQSFSGLVRDRQKKDGTIIKASISFAPVTSRQGETEYIVAILDDITERIHAEEKLKTSEHQLRLLTARLQKAREEERLLISREIHDEFGQRLTAILIDLDLLNQHMTKDRVMVSNPVFEEIESIKNKVDDTITLIKRYAKELRPPTLDHLGLLFTMQSHLREYEQNTKIACRWESDIDGIEFTSEQSINIFRIYQESLTNIARHAKAAHVIISFKKSADHLILRIEDDGVGIKDVDIAAMKSTGITGMQERSRMIDGVLSITKGEAKGSVITLTIPQKQLNALV